MRAEFFRSIGVGRIAGSLMIGVLVLGNLILLGLNFQSIELPIITTYSHSDPVSRAGTVAATRLSLDTKPAQDRPLFSPDRTPYSGQTEMVGTRTEKVDEKTREIEFRGIVERGGIIFAVCRTSGLEKVRLLAVGEELEGWRVVDISRDKFVIELAGKQRIFHLSRSLTEVGIPNSPNISGALETDSLVIGPGMR